MTILSQVGADGVLNVTVPLSSDDANLPVQLTIEPTSENGGRSADFEIWLDGISGSWKGDFVRGDEGEFETREPLS